MQYRITLQKAMDQATRKYLAEIGSRGGKKSKRSLSKEQAQALARKSWEKRKSKTRKNAP